MSWFDGWSSKFEGCDGWINWEVFLSSFLFSLFEDDFIWSTAWFLEEKKEDFWKVFCVIFGFFYLFFFFESEKWELLIEITLQEDFVIFEEKKVNFEDNNEFY